MGLDVADRPRVDAGHRLRERDDLGLAVHARRRVGDPLRAVVVHGEAADHGEDAVAALERVREALEHDDARAAAEDGPVRLRVERAAVAVRRDHPALEIQVAPDLREADRDAAGERRVALVVKEAPARHRDRDERRRAGRLDVDARPAEVQLVGEARREEVPVVPEQDGERAHLELLGDVAEERAVRRDLGREVRVHARARVDADESGIRRGIERRVLERLLADLEEDAGAAGPSARPPAGSRRRRTRRRGRPRRGSPAPSRSAGRGSSPRGCPPPGARRPRGAGSTRRPRGRSSREPRRSGLPGIGRRGRRSRRRQTRDLRAALAAAASRWRRARSATWGAASAGAAPSRRRARASIVGCSKSAVAGRSRPNWRWISSWTSAARRRAAAEVEEVVAPADVRHAQHRGPDSGQALLPLGGGGRECGRELRPVGGWCRQGGAVDFPVRGEWNRVDPDERRGKHVVRKADGGASAQVVVPGGARQVGGRPMRRGASRPGLRRRRARQHPARLIAAGGRSRPRRARPGTRGSSPGRPCGRGTRGPRPASGVRGRPSGRFAYPRGRRTGPP